MRSVTCLPVGHRRTSVAWLLLLGFTILSAGSFLAVAAPTDSDQSSLPSATSQPTSRPAAGTGGQVAINIADVRREALVDAKAGKFRQALSRLRTVRGKATAPAVEEASCLLERYLSARQKTDMQRRREYLDAVERVKRSLIVHAFMSGPKATGPDDVRPLAESGPVAQSRPSDGLDIENLRKRVRKIVDVCAGVDDGDALELATAKQAQELREQTYKSFSEGESDLAGLIQILAGQESQYAKNFIRAARALAGKIADSRTTWSKLQSETVDGRLDAAMALREHEDETFAALGDLEMMVSKDAWQIALGQAYLAKLLADDGTDFSGQEWYLAVKAMAEQQGLKGIADANWYDALRAYSGLSELEPENEVYKGKVKAVRRHVRVLALYGREEQGDVSTQPVEERATWRDRVANVDIAVVRSAITEISSYYVRKVDYRRIATAALNAVEILAQTPQAAESFPYLRDSQRKNDFVEAIEKQKDAIEKDDRVDHQHIKAALNAVYWASQRTVEIPVEALAVEFAEGMLDELDRFSAIVWPHDAPDFIKQTSGKFYGVGIQITKEAGESLKVVTPLADTPAFRQGIKSGDTIVAVNGHRTDVLSIDKLVRMITGEKGTRVTLSIQRSGLKKPKDYSIVRDEILIRTVKGWRRMPDGEWDYMIDPQSNIGYIRLTQFTEQTIEDLLGALDVLKARGVRSVVVDLRYNPGGLLQSAAAVADQFLRGGLVVSTKARSMRQAAINASRRGRYLDGDLVVLVNRYSASAAEIVSGALKDWHRAIIIGERTYGKGSVQHVITLREKEAYLKLTAAYYYLPSGRLLHRENSSKTWGVDPHVKVQLTPRQTRRWLAIRRKTDLLQDIAPGRLTSDLNRQLDADLQLNAAVVLLKLMQLDQPKAAA